MDETQELIRAYEDIASLVGATHMARTGEMTRGEAQTLLNQIVGEWSERRMLLFFLSCVFNKMAQLHGKLATHEGVEPSTLLSEDYRKIFGE